MGLAQFQPPYPLVLSIKAALHLVKAALHLIESSVGLLLHLVKAPVGVGPQLINLLAGLPLGILDQSHVKAGHRDYRCDQSNSYY